MVAASEGWGVVGMVVHRSACDFVRQTGRGGWAALAESYGEFRSDPLATPRLSRKERARTWGTKHPITSPLKPKSGLNGAPSSRDWGC